MVFRCVAKSVVTPFRLRNDFSVWRSVIERGAHDFQFRMLVVHRGLYVAMPHCSHYSGKVWDTQENATYPRPIDTWVLANGTGLFVGRADGLAVEDVYVFSRNTGIIQTDSPDTSQNVLCGTDTGSDIDLVNVQYGIVVSCTWAL